MKTGRNDLCPCGSGKKYKNCCMEKDRVLPGETSFDLLMYAEEWILGQPEFEKEFERLMIEYLDWEGEIEGIDERSVADAFVFDYVMPDGVTNPFEYFLDNADLSPHVREIYEKFSEQVFSVFEVLEVYRNEGLRLKDLTCGKEYRVTEKALTHHAVPGYVLFCRLAPFKSDFIITTPSPGVYPQNAGYAIKRAFDRVIFSPEKPITWFDIMKVLKPKEKDAPEDKPLDEIKKLFTEKLDELGINIDLRTLSKRINESTDPREAFPEIYEFDYSSKEDFAKIHELLILLWNKHPRKQFGGKSPDEISLIGPREKMLILDLIRDAQMKINPDDYGSAEDVKDAINKFADEWANTPQKELDGKTPMDAVLEERELLGNPNKEFNTQIELMHAEYHEKDDETEKLHEKGINLFNKGDLSGAAEYFKKLTCMYPDDYGSWRRRGDCLSGLGKKKDAAECYEKAPGKNKRIETMEQKIKKTGDDLMGKLKGVKKIKQAEKILRENKEEINAAFIDELYGISEETSKKDPKYSDFIDEVIETCYEILEEKHFNNLKILVQDILSPEETISRKSPAPVSKNEMEELLYKVFECHEDIIDYDFIRYVMERFSDIDEEELNEMDKFMKTMDVKSVPSPEDVMAGDPRAVEFGRMLFSVVEYCVLELLAKYGLIFLIDKENKKYMPFIDVLLKEKSKAKRRELMEKEGEFVNQEFIEFLITKSGILRHEEPKKALPVANIAVEVAEFINDDTLRGRCIINLGIAKAYCKQFDEGLKLIEEAKKLFCNDDLFHKIECDLNTAEIYFLRGELDFALKLYKKAKEDFAEIDTDPRDMADVDLHIAEIYKKRKDFKNAVIHYEMAKFNFEQSGDFEEAGETDESIRECINKMR